MPDVETGDMLRDWDAHHYLQYYYGHQVVPEDEAVMFRFIAAGLRQIGRHFPIALELGCGPALHHAAQIVPWVGRLDMADFQESNLEEIRRWIDKDARAFDWSVYIAGKNGALDAEQAGVGLLADREAAMRSRINLLRCDLRKELPLGGPAQYPLIVSCYCTEWVRPDLAGWHETMRVVGSMVSKGGWLFLLGVHATEYCVINGRRVPCARLTEPEIRRGLAASGFDVAGMRFQVTPGLAPGVSGIQGTFMAYAQRLA